MYSVCTVYTFMSRPSKYYRDITEWQNIGTKEQRNNAAPVQLNIGGKHLTKQPNNGTTEQIINATLQKQNNRTAEQDRQKYEDLNSETTEEQNSERTEEKTAKHRKKRTAKQRKNNRTTKQQNNRTMKQRKNRTCETAEQQNSETTKVPYNKTTEELNSETTEELQTWLGIKKNSPICIRIGSVLWRNLQTLVYNCSNIWVCPRVPCMYSMSINWGTFKVSLELYLEQEH